MPENKLPEIVVPSEEEAAAASKAQDDVVQSLSLEQAVQTLRLMKARAEAETAEYQKRLVMQQFRPCKLYPVIVYHDGMRWVCCYGVFGDKYREYLPENALGQSGVEAYGTSPEDAMSNFDAMWLGNVGDSEDNDDADSDDD